jgi:hypothetical protein
MRKCFAFSPSFPYQWSFRLKGGIFFLVVISIYAVVKSYLSEWLFGWEILLIVILFFPTVLLYQNFTDPIYWFVELALLTLIFLFLRYYPSTNNTEVNSNEKTIKINSNNLIGKSIIPTLDISFNNFKEFTFKAKSIKGKGMTNHFNRIYISYDDQTRPLIDLPNGPFYYVNHRTFMNCLTKIIKNGA